MAAVYLTAEERGALMTERQAAQYLSLAPATLRKWRSDGVGPRYIRIRGGRLERGGIRYRARDLDECMELVEPSGRPGGPKGE